MLNIQKVIPHIPSINMSVTSEFFTNLFEFKITVNSEYFVELNNDERSIGLLKTDKLENEQSIYIQVSDIDTLWHDIKDQIAPYKHKPLFVQEYGMKEFHVIIPKTTTLLIVGEPVHA